MQQQQSYGHLGLVGHAVHRVGADHHEIRTAPLKALRRHDHPGSQIVPAPGMLQRLDFPEVEGPTSGIVPSASHSGEPERSD